MMKFISTIPCRFGFHDYQRYINTNLYRCKYCGKTVNKF